MWLIIRMISSYSSFQTLFHIPIIITCSPSASHLPSPFNILMQFSSISKAYFRAFKDIFLPFPFLLSPYTFDPLDSGHQFTQPDFLSAA